MHTRAHTRRTRAKQRHRQREKERERGMLNHIISTQIINDIIFGCSLYNVGQLDARGNKEGVRETE